MYRPPAFRIDDQAALALVARVGFGHVVHASGDGFDALPAPFLVDADGAGDNGSDGDTTPARSLRFHVARANPLWRIAPCPVLVVVPVSDAYVSPSWYPSKAEHGEVVPTWNYEVVNIHGRLVAHDDPEWVAQVVRELTEREEADISSPWSVDDAPPTYISKMLRAIVGLEVQVERVEGKRKLSQNRSDADRAGVMTGLSERVTSGAAPVAGAMRELG